MDNKKQDGANIKKDLSYDEKVIKKIAGIATDDVPGILTVSGGLIGTITDAMRSDHKTSGIDADVGKKQVALDLNVVCEYGRNVPDLFNAVANKVSTAIRDMTGLEVVELNMHVEDVLNKADFDDQREKQNIDDEDEYKKTYVNSQSAQSAQTARVQ